MAELTHLDRKGRARMVDVSGKRVTRRLARARCTLRMQPATLEKILSGEVPKGDVLAVARTAGIQAAKQTPALIPLCHSLALDAVQVDFHAAVPDGLVVESTVTVTARTGAEMEALVAAALAGLTVYDMCKAVDRGMSLSQVELLEKRGGRSGTYRRKS